MHEYKIYYEPADSDTEKVYLGIITADSAAEALQKASEYWEYPSHDLVCEQIS